MCRRQVRVHGAGKGPVPAGRQWLGGLTCRRARQQIVQRFDVGAAKGHAEVRNSALDVELAASHSFQRTRTLSSQLLKSPDVGCPPVADRPLPSECWDVA